MTRRFTHVGLDIRDREGIFALFREQPFDLVVHCAAQPSHDKARDIPILDFEVNARGTVHLLEATRLFAPGAVFIHMSTNKVYGDAPNELPLVEGETRFDYARPEDLHGVSEEMRIDRCLHSLFGASKTAADVVAQEYGRYFGLKVGVFRGGCLTGPTQSGVELHGFLSYLVKAAVTGETYTVFGYKGKQVRDNIHSHPDVVDMDYAVDTEGKSYLPDGHFDKSVDPFGRPSRWSEGEGHFASEIAATPEGVVVKAKSGTAQKAKRPMAAILKT